MASGCDSFEEADGLRESALLCVDQALLLEEGKNIKEAVIMYQKALAKLDEALAKYNHLGDNATVDKKRLRLSSLKQQVLFRLQEHKMSVPNSSLTGPSIDDSELPSDADILFSIPKEVQIFYITASGEVSCPSYPTSLHIFRFKDSGAAGGDPSLQPAFLKVGSWVYPLIPGKSPVLKSQIGKYMFPDIDSSIEGNAIGLIFPSDLPEDDAQVFDIILEHLTAAVQRKAEDDLKSYDEYMQFSTALSSGMVKGAEYVGVGLMAASVKASQLLHTGTEKLKEQIEPDAQAPEIDPRLKTGLEVAKWTASKGAQGTGYLVSKVGTATLALGRFLAPHIRRQGALALSHLVEQSDQKSQKQMDIVGEVASGTVKAFGTIYMSLENSSKILLQNMANNTVNIVSHKYGGEVGSLTENALSAAGNTYLTVYNAAALGPKGIAKRVAKNTGKVLVNVDPEKDENEPKKLKENSERDSKKLNEQ